MILTLGLVKVPIAALMIWIPLRSDAAMEAGEPADSSDEDGGSKTLPGGPCDRHPRAPRRGPSPRRGPHGGAAHPSPTRTRRPRRSITRVEV